MQRCLRVIHVINVRWFNATAWYGLSLAKLLHDAGHEVKVIAQPGTEPFHRAEAMIPKGAVGVSFNPFSIAQTIRNICLIRKIIREFRPHVVNCHRGEGMVLWALLKAMGGNFALVRTRGDQRSPKANPVNKYLYASMADAVIATNSRTERLCASLLGVPREKLCLIPGGVDRKFFSRNDEGREQVRRGYGFSDKDLVLGVLGRFDPVKGHRELMDALVPVLKNLQEKGGRNECVRLMLMGFPANISLDAMRRMVREHGLEDRTVITGKVEDVAAHISAMDLGVVSSQGSEAIARAAFEIMSCGVPLLGTDVGVMPDLLTPEALAPLEDKTALSALLLRALRDPDFRHGLAAKQAARMPAFSQEAFLEQSLAAYSDALGRAGVTDREFSPPGCSQ